jgi:hypothetical protein
MSTDFSVAVFVGGRKSTSPCGPKKVMGKDGVNFCAVGALQPARRWRTSKHLLGKGRLEAMLVVNKEQSYLAKTKPTRPCPVPGLTN